MTRLMNWSVSADRAPMEFSQELAMNLPGLDLVG